MSMPDPPVDQTDPLTRSVPNPQLDQTELLPLSVLEQLPVLDLLLKVVPMCETAVIVSGYYDQLSNLTRIRDRDPVFSSFLLNVRRTNCGVFVNQTAVHHRDSACTQTTD